MKNFKDYKGFMDGIIKLTLDLDIEDDFIVTFSCLEPILKDCRPTYKRVKYVEVCGWSPNTNDMIWFNDWYEGCQTSFDIESVISIVDVSMMQAKLHKYENLFNDMRSLSREAYEAIGVLEDGFRKENEI